MRVQRREKMSNKNIVCQFCGSVGTVNARLVKKGRPSLTRMAMGVATGGATMAVSAAAGSGMVSKKRKHGAYTVLTCTNCNVEAHV
jgi:hypothetical protein